MIKYFLYKIGKIFAGSLPLKAAYRLAVCLSDIQYFCCPKDRRAVQDNLRAVCGPDVDVRALSRQVFRNFGKYLVEFFRMETFTQDFMRENVVIENQQVLNEALAKGRGVIVITAHLGNWEMGGVMLGRMGYSLTAVALPHKERPVNELFNRQRSVGGVTVVPAQFAFRRCLRTLKDNGIIALLADRDFSATGSVMDFFGKKTMIPHGAAMLAYRTRAVVIPMFLTREDEEGKFRITIRDPFDTPEASFSGDEEMFRVFFMKQQAALLEREIRQNPAQWMLFRRFWISEEKGPERIMST